MTKIRNVISDSRILVMGLAAALFAVAGALYVFDQALYQSVMARWMVYLLPVPFADSAYVMAQIECARAGVDVYAANPCDIYGRVHAYSPLWLRLWPLPASREATIPFALSLIAGFILSLGLLPRVKGRVDTAMLLAAVASPVTAYAVERGNVDLLIFILGALAVVCMERSAPGRLCGYALIMFAGLLKFYPVVMMSLALRERPRTATILEAGVLGVLGGFGWLWHDELGRMVHNIPEPEYGTDGLGGRRLAEGLAVLGSRAASWLTGGSDSLASDFTLRHATILLVLAVLLIGAGLLARGVGRAEPFGACFRDLSTRESLCLVAGGALFCGCFVTGSSVVYREIFLLLAAPALLRFRAAHDLVWPVRLTPFVVVLLLWSVPIADAVEQVAGPIVGDAGSTAAFVFWLIRETAWWWVFTVMLSALLRFAREARPVSQRQPSERFAREARPVSQRQPSGDFVLPAFAGPSAPAATRPDQRDLISGV